MIINHRVMHFDVCDGYPCEEGWRMGALRCSALRIAEFYYTYFRMRKTNGAEHT